MDEIEGIARVKFHHGKLEGGPKLFTPWMALQDPE
jgi:hypothetical protein